MVLIAVLLLIMFAWNIFQWHRGGDAWDMSNFNQAAWLIIHGDFNPYSSVSGGGYFLQQHFALFFYPLMLVYAVHPSGLTLLLLQDVAIALACLMTLRWIIEMFAHQLDQDPPVLTPRMAVWCVGLFAVILVFDPLLWQGISFDFHPEAFTALFLVLAARSFWHRRTWIALAWCMLALTTADFAGLYVAALGLGVVLAGKGIRRFGLAAIAAGTLWMLLVGLLGANQGDALPGYAYITAGAAGGGTVTVPRLAMAMVAHPGRWLTMLGSKPLDLYRNVVPTGILGIVSPWSLALVPAVILPAALLVPPIFIESGFQTIPAVFVGLCGSVFLLLWIGRALSRRWNPLTVRMILGVIVLAVFAQFVGDAIVMLPRIPPFWIRVSAAQGAAIRRAANLVPEDAQVIGSMPVLGHFSGRRWVDPIVSPGQAYAIEARTVYFLVAPTAGIISMAPAESELAVANAVRLGARPVLNENDVTLLRWHPERLGASIVLVPKTS
jgi:hypothetical protein